ncbi:MAG TPA: succinylglutamate desuccinylase/aspartoacylase family protein, partial [Bacillota bacterium]|nr:succinylglutamate desuccinylase/aspartoacylase family protein [Bacillota bacterium]
MRVLVIGGMHGNEPLGVTLVKRLQQQPIKNVDAVLANEPAIAQNCRFIANDLNRSFPGKRPSKQYEQRRAAELLQLCGGYDVVLDFHNTHCAGNDC